MPQIVFFMLLALGTGEIPERAANPYCMAGGDRVGNKVLLNLSLPSDCDGYIWGRTREVVLLEGGPSEDKGVP